MDIATGCFGKLPAHGDFLRLLPPGIAAPDRLVDGWFQAAGLDQTRHPDRAAAFAAAAPAFALVPHQGRWWALASFPSQDAVGRQHPFTVAAGISAFGMDEEVGLLPILFAPFFQAAYARHLGGWPATPDALAAACRELTAGVDEAGAQAALVAGLESTTQGALWGSLLGDPLHPGRAGVLAMLAAPPPRMLRISPLVHQMPLAFVLMAVQLIHGAEGAPALIAMLATAPGSAAVLYGQPRPEACTAALWPGLAPASFHEGACDLAAGRASGAGELAALGDGRDSLRDLLHRLVAARRTHVYRRR